jgi:hypothetical protein
MIEQVYCHYCKQPLYSVIGEQGLEIASCVVCMAKIETDFVRDFIRRLPQSLLAAARTLEKESGGA